MKDNNSYEIIIKLEPGKVRLRDKIAFWKKTGTFNFSAQFGKNGRLIGLNEIPYREQGIFLQMLGQTAEGVKGCTERLKEIQGLKPAKKS